MSVEIAHLSHWKTIEFGSHYFSLLVWVLHQLIWHLQQIICYSLITHLQAVATSHRVIRVILLLLLSELCDRVNVIQFTRYWSFGCCSHCEVKLCWVNLFWFSQLNYSSWQFCMLDVSCTWVWNCCTIVESKCTSEPVRWTSWSWWMRSLFHWQALHRLSYR